LGTSERFWINPQARYDLELENDRLGAALGDSPPLSAAGDANADRQLNRADLGYSAFASAGFLAVNRSSQATLKPRNTRIVCSTASVRSA
jgi:hypothetical protein